MILARYDYEGHTRWLLPSRITMPVLIVLMLVVHFALQIFSANFSFSEWEWGGAILYLLSGGLILLVAAESFRHAVSERSQFDLFQGIALCMLSVTFLFIGLGLAGLFGLLAQDNASLGYYLLVFGLGLSGIFFLFAPRQGKLHAAPHIVMVSLALLIVFLVGLYQLHATLPSLFIADGVPSLWRQQLVTIVQVLFVLASIRYALLNRGKTSQSAQWHLIGMGTLALIATDFLLSTGPGDAYSWAGRLFTVLAAGAFIQSLWWKQKGE
ncbi:MAG: hypothetical protein Q8P05_04435 [Candidatus Diapherotrites archaeon]|nr:hypothetical protein [Candidatus Diapherotrites archaeon]